MSIEIQKMNNPLGESLFNILNQNWGKSEEKKVWLSVKVLGGEVVIANVAAIFLI